METWEISIPRLGLRNNVTTNPSQNRYTVLQKMDKKNKSGFQQNRSESESNQVNMRTSMRKGPRADQINASSSFKLGNKKIEKSDNGFSIQTKTIFRSGKSIYSNDFKNNKT